MTPISDTFAIDINARLDRYHIFSPLLREYYLTFFFSLLTLLYVLQPLRELMNLILEKGHSRVPVYYEQPTNIIGLILVYALYSSVTLWNYSAQSFILSGVDVNLFPGTFYK